LLNFIALNGWNPGGEQEVFTLPELIKKFDILKVQKGGGIFNPEKLEWFNREHIKLLPQEKINKNILEWLPENMRNPKIIPIILERISKWEDVKEMAQRGELDFFFRRPEFHKKKLLFKNTSPEKISANLNQAIKALEELDEKNFSKENIKTTLMAIADKLDSRGEILHPVRFALSGLDKSPDPFIIAEILGKNETLSRLQKAI